MDTGKISSAEEQLAALEGGEFGFLFPSGISAMSAVLDMMDHGGHVVASEDVSYATYRLFENIRHRTSAMTFSFVDMADISEISAAVTEQTRMIWLEIPFVRNGVLPDLAKIAELAKSRELMSVCDHSAFTGAVIKPLVQGFDIAVYSDLTSLAGRTGCRGGAVVYGSGLEIQSDKFSYLRNALGLLPYEKNADVVRDALGDLTQRSAQQAETAAKIAALLEGHAGVLSVKYPAIGSCLAFEVDGDIETAEKFAHATSLFACAVGPGGRESHIEHPATMSHGSIPLPIRQELGITDNLIYLFAGCENTDDLIADLEQAFQA